jgi:hypothetical protein
VITEWRGEGKSKEQITEDIENFIKKKHKGSYSQIWYNINEDQVLVEMEEWSGKEKAIKQKGKLRENKLTEKILIDNFTKQERQIQKKLRTIAKEEKRKGKEVKVGYRKITIGGVQWRWNEERGRLEIFD